MYYTWRRSKTRQLTITESAAGKGVDLEMETLPENEMHGGTDINSKNSVQQLQNNKLFCCLTVIVNTSAMKVFYVNFPLVTLHGNVFMFEYNHQTDHRVRKLKYTHTQACTIRASCVCMAGKWRCQVLGK